MKFGRMRKTLLQEKFMIHLALKLHGIKLNREMVNGIWGIFQVRNTLKCINYIWMM